MGRAPNSWVFGHLQDMLRLGRDMRRDTASFCWDGLGVEASKGTHTYILYIVRVNGFGVPCPQVESATHWCSGNERELVPDLGRHEVGKSNQQTRMPHAASAFLPLFFLGGEGVAGPFVWDSCSHRASPSFTPSPKPPRCCPRQGRRGAPRLARWPRAGDLRLRGQRCRRRARVRFWDVLGTS